MKPKTFSRVVEVLRAHGFVFLRCRGSHHHYHKPGSALIITVPFHGSNAVLKIGTLKSIMRQAGIAEDEL